MCVHMCAYEHVALVGPEAAAAVAGRLLARCNNAFAFAITSAELDMMIMVVVVVVSNQMSTVMGTQSMASMGNTV